MTPDEQKKLRPGEMIHHQTMGRHMVVRVEDDGTVHIVAIREMDLPSEWSTYEVVMPSPPPAPEPAPAIAAVPVKKPSGQGFAVAEPSEPEPDTEPESAVREGPIVITPSITPAAPVTP